VAPDATRQENLYRRMAPSIFSSNRPQSRINIAFRLGARRAKPSKREGGAMSQTQTMPSVSAVLASRTENDRPGAFAVAPAAGIVHDLGNLIQIASSAVNIVARNPRIQADDLAILMSGARTSLDRAGALVRQTLGTARERIAAVEHVSVAACLSEIEALVRATWGRTVRLDVRAEPNLPSVACDPLALQNAVLNLIFNARDAMPGGGVIAIRAAFLEPEAGPIVELCVADSGIGMKPETVASAFDPFFTTKCDGLGGVGLPMVERFVREAGGNVAIESEYGAGTTVRLRLPASPRTTLAGAFAV
jgi:signal transduction histidine kinase